MEYPLLDPQPAIALLSNKVNLYRRLLERFQKSYSDGLYQIAEHYAVSKRNASQTAHTLKGISLNLGASRLHQLSKSLDLLLKESLQESSKGSVQNEPDIESLVLECQQCLDSTAEEISSWLKNNAA